MISTSAVTQLLQERVKFPLFDIDGTLVRAGSHVHHGAFDYALHTVFKLPQASHHDVDRSGKIDPQILIEIAQVHGMSEEEAKQKVPSAMKAMVYYFERHKDTGEHILLEGVEELLQTLYEKHIPIGLLTGNVEEIGWAKMELVGIRKYFSYGAFGNAAFKREDLIPIAHEQLEATLKKEIAPKRLVIIGDTERDIACARSGGIEVIAVTTGRSSQEELAKLHPDLLVSSLVNQQPLLSFLNVQ